MKDKRGEKREQTKTTF